MTKYLLSLVRHQLQASTLLGFHQRVSSRACRPALILNRKLSIKQNKSGPRASSHLAASLDPQTIYNPAGKHKNSNKTIRNQFQYTLLFSNPTKLKAQDLALPLYKPLFPTQVPLLVILVSKGFASLLQKDNDFVETLVGQIFQWHAGEVNVVAAVVDRIFNPVDPIGTELAPNQGAEGISLWLTDTAKAAEDLWHQCQNQPSSCDTIRGAIELSFSSRRSTLPLEFVDGVQLPLSETIFENGRMSTLSVQKFTAAQVSGFQLAQHSMPARLRLRAGDNHKGQSKWLNIGQMHVLNLTKPRMVKSAMGNVIRELEYSDDEGTSTILASKELESVINSMARKDIGEIWAFIQPQGLATPIEYELGIRSGCRLHKVLSGGAGWGVQGGLIALDPETSLMKDNQDLPLNDHDSLDWGPLGNKALEEIIKPGDVVTFCALDPEIKRKAEACQESHSSRTFRATGAMRFSSYPSPTEQIGYVDATETQTDDTVSTIELLNFFGTSTASPLSYSLEAVGPNNEKYWGVQRLGKTVQTKLPPGTELRYNTSTLFTEVKEQDKAASDNQNPLTQLGK